MSTINNVETVLSIRGSSMVLWETLTCGDNGDAFEIKDYMGSLTFQAVGTFNSEHLTIEGSNDGTNWSTLNGSLGSSMDFTSDDIMMLGEYPRYVRPAFSGSSGGDVDVYLFTA